MSEQIEFDFGITLKDNLSEEERKDYRVCTRCRKVRHATDFHKDNTRKRKIRAVCKSCVNELWNVKYKNTEFRKNYNINKKAMRKKRTERLGKLKQKFGCIDCGYNKEPWALHFDHVDPTKKVAAISSMTRQNLKNIFEEIRKCVVRCANCHAEKTRRKEDYLIRREEQNNV